VSHGIARGKWRGEEEEMCVCVWGGGGGGGWGGGGGGGGGGGLGNGARGERYEGSGRKEVALCESAISKYPVRGG